MKTKVIIVYPNMSVGGSTTSLIGFLSVLDYSRLDVALLLYRNEGPLLEELPQSVNLLKQAARGKSRNADRLIRFLNPNYVVKRIIGKIVAQHSDYKLAESQLMVYEEAKQCRHDLERYDIAISYLEGWPSVYVYKYIQAPKKIAWVHVDYESAGLNPAYDRKMYERFDKIITVSEICKKNMQKSFPEIASKITWIGNISSVDSIIKKSKDSIDIKLDSSKINLFSACRISIRHKGLDRMLKAIREYNTENETKIKWYIAGKGHDEREFREIINNYGLTNDVVLLGELKNPFPYEKEMDAFVLLSRYEGKPMAVTEAQVLGLPVVVAEYASAQEQICCGYSGFIFPNDDNQVVEAFVNTISKDVLVNMKNNLRSSGFSFDKEKKEINTLLLG